MLSLSLSLSLVEVKTDRKTDNFGEGVTRENLPSVGIDYYYYIKRINNLNFVELGHIRTFVSAELFKSAQITI